MSDQPDRYETDPDDSSPTAQQSTDAPASPDHDKASRVSELKHVKLRYTLNKGGAENVDVLKMGGADGVRAIFLDHALFEDFCRFLRKNPSDAETQNPDKEAIEEKEESGPPGGGSMRGRSSHPLCYFVGNQIYCP